MTHPLLQFVAVAEVSGVAESWHDVFMFVQSLVDRSAPDSGLILWEGLLYVLDTFGRSEDASHVDVLRGALGKERLHTHLHADAGGKHRVGDDERLVGEVWGSQILNVNTNLGMFLVGIFALSTNEGIARMVEDVQETLVERQTGTEDGADDNLVGRKIDLCHAQRGGHLFRLIIEGL